MSLPLLPIGITVVVVRYTESRFQRREVLPDLDRHIDPSAEEVRHHGYGYPDSDRTEGRRETRGTWACTVFRPRIRDPVRLLLLLRGLGVTKERKVGQYHGLFFRSLQWITLRVTDFLFLPTLFGSLHKSQCVKELTEE